MRREMKVKVQETVQEEHNEDEDEKISRRRRGPAPGHRYSLN